MGRGFSPEKMYQKQKEPFEVTDEMKRGAEELEENEAKRVGDTEGEREFTEHNVDEWNPEVKETNLHDDHGSYQ